MYMHTLSCLHNYVNILYMYNTLYMYIYCLHYLYKCVFVTVCTSTLYMYSMYMYIPWQYYYTLLCLYTYVNRWSHTYRRQQSHLDSVLTSSPVLAWTSSSAHCCLIRATPRLQPWLQNSWTLSSPDQGRLLLTFLFVVILLNLKGFKDKWRNTIFMWRNKYLVQ